MIRLVHIFLLMCFFVPFYGGAQYAPPAGQAGTTAIHIDSSMIIGWASVCQIERGYLDVSNPDFGFVDHGQSVDATGKADQTVVSLGDGGIATLEFAIPIANGPGFDFAVFENSFSDAFLELAFVEVSSDGDNFFRFDAISLTQTDVQVGVFGELDASKINNLAGKYRASYGVPFDLAELKGSVSLDINKVRWVRLIDVVGSVDDQFASFDSKGNAVNDPWPTAFSSGGFDLDAVGVIHNQNNLDVVEAKANLVFNVYPNPVANHLRFASSKRVDKLEIIDQFGNKLIEKKDLQVGDVVDVSRLKTDLLFVRATIDGQVIYRKILKY